MTRRSTGLVLAVLLGNGAGCGKEDKPTAGSCSIPSFSMCVDLNPILAGDDAQCANLGGIWSPGAACPTANLVGSCAVSDPTQSAVISFYLPIGDTTARDACVQNGGVYTPTCAYLQGSCDLSAVTSVYQCIEHFCGISTAEPTNCASAGGTWSATATCSTTNLVGTCRVSGAGTLSRYYYYPTHDDVTAGAACASVGGTYTP